MPPSLKRNKIFCFRPVPAFVLSRTIHGGFVDLRRTEMGGEAPIRGGNSWEDVMLNQTAIAALKSELRGELIEPNDTRGRNGR